ncbi:flagellar biosynthesis protein FlhB [Vibrio mediterranei]|uniref:flagellar biosynthesis protein FlhB n=1 Tax=Vibrio mediterranei TaxID=689 RepID=UPI004067A85F
MSENANKTEQATPHKLKEARKKGQLSRSKDLSSAAAMLTAVFYIAFYIPDISDVFYSLFKFTMTFSGESLHQGFEFGLLLDKGLSSLLSIFTPLLFLQLFIIPVATFIVGGMSFNLVQLKPKFSKINPIEGVKRIFSGQTIFELIKSIIKISSVFVLFYYTVKSGIVPLSALPRSSLTGSYGYIGQYLLQYSLILLLAMFFYAAIDTFYQKHAFAKKMRMSKQEIKDEHKEQDGRPEVKQRIRQVQMQQAKRSVNHTVPTADMILVNPTHYSVAIRYDLTKADAPYVVAKGVDEMALYIREIAKKNNIPILEYPKLTREIYGTTSIDQMIPTHLYKAIAQILSYVKQLSLYRSGLISKPDTPEI